MAERWSSQLLEAALFGDVTLPSVFELRLGIDLDILATRLDEFIASGLMDREQGVAPSFESSYTLTQKGRALAPSLLALAAWADEWIGLETTSTSSVVWQETFKQLIECDLCEEEPTPPTGAPRSFSNTDVLTALGQLVRDAPLESRSSPPRTEIFLLGTFNVLLNGEVPDTFPVGTQRILAYLALHDRTVTRVSMAGTMWPEVSDQSAGGSLRSALSRLDEPLREMIRTASGGLRLSDHVTVDFLQSQALAHRLLRQDAEIDDADLEPEAVHALSSDLLPDWYDDWVIAEAEDWRQLRLNALETQAILLGDCRRWPEAASAARAAVNAEPLRESAQAILIRVHLGQGNQSEALTVYNRYKALLEEELGLQPTSHITDLVSHLLGN